MSALLFCIDVKLFLIQTDVEKIKVRDAAKKCSVQVSVEMPFNINNIESPTHKIK